MKKLLLVILTLGMCAMMFAQSWEVVKQGPDAIGTAAAGASFIDASTGWVVADEGLVRKTTDGGNTWTIIRDAVAGSEDWNDVDFVDANIGFACADEGEIYKTIDGGTTWALVSDTAYVLDLNGLDALNANLVYFAGDDGVFLKSTDGCATYTQSAETFLGEDLDGGVAFSSETMGVVLMDGTAGLSWYTTDGGTTWTEVSLAAYYPPGTASTRVYDVATVAGTSTFVVTGYSYVTLISTDGGATYTRIGGLSYGYDRNEFVDMVDENTFFIAGDYLARTQDGGATFDTLYTGSGQSYDVVEFFDANTGFVAQANGIWKTTTDGGQTWNNVFDWPSLSFHGMGIPEDNKLLFTAFAGGEITETTDNGVNFTYPNNYASGTVGNIYECEFVNANVGFIGGGYGFLSKTTDGGQSFTPIVSPMALASNKHINAIHVYNENAIFAGGSSGYVMKSSDGGVTWSDTKIQSKTVYDMCALDENTIITSESSGVIGYGVFDGDAVVTDSLIVDIGTNSMRGVKVRNGVVLVACSSGLIYRGDVNDLASIAQIFEEPDGDDFYDVEFVDDNLVYAVGEAGKIYKSEDAGLTWTQEVSSTEETLQKVKYNNNKLWAIGQGGVILCLDMTPAGPYTLPITEAATDGTLDLDWVYNTYNGEGTLEVLDSTTSAWGSHVIKYTDDGNTGIVHVDRAAFENYTISSDVYIVGPTDPDAPLYAGLAIKSLHDDLGYYRFVYRNSSSDNGILKLQGYDGSNWHISAAWTPDVDFDVLETGWHNMKVTVIGNEFWAYIDGQVLPGCPFVDESPVLSEGYPGIFVYNDPANSVMFDNFMVTEPEATPVSVTFNVDMSVQITTGNFTAGTDVLDVAGSFNSWGETIMLLDDADGDQIYTTTVDGLTAGETLEYKFRINSNWDTSEFSNGGSNRTYVLPDSNSTVDVFYNDEATPNAIDDNANLPKRFALHQNYPNPFNPTTNIAFELPNAVAVRLDVFNLQGQRVANLKNEVMQAGYYNVNIDASDFASGVYIYKIQAGNFVSMKKMTLLK